MNTITIVGNLVREPEIHYTENGAVFANFSIADNGFAKGEKTTIFWKVIMFGAAAENFGNEAVKGREYTIKGICTPNSYVDKNGIERHEIGLQAECYKNGRLPKSAKTDNQQEPSYKNQNTQNHTKRSYTRK